MTGDPLVSIRCTVYNHEPFLRQCLDGFVMQETSFPFEAIVHDDASTDGSAAIIREYAEKYPDIIKPIYETENQHSKRDGSIGRIMDAAIHPSAKYIATCEGDDYWTDPHKLQLQVDFLESHPDYVMSCHIYSVYYEETKVREAAKRKIEETSTSVWKGNEYHTFTNDDYYNIWFTHTLTTVRRRIKYIDEEKKKQYPFFFDFIFFYYFTKQGKCAYFEKDMATYRVHQGGIFSGSDTVTWNEYYLTNCYVLYKLENEKRVIPSMNDKFRALFIHLLKQREFKRAFFVIKRHNSEISTTNTLICIGKLCITLFAVIFRKIKLFVRNVNA